MFFFVNLSDGVPSFPSLPRFLALFVPSFIPRSRGFPLVDICVLDPHRPSNVLPATVDIGPDRIVRANAQNIVRSLAKPFFQLSREIYPPSGPITRYPCADDRPRQLSSGQQRERQRVRGRHLGALAETGPCAMAHGELSGGVRRSPTRNNPHKVANPRHSQPR